MTETIVAVHPRVLVVEDNDADVFLLREAVSLHNLGVDLDVVDNGAMAIAWIEKTDNDPSATCPSLCLLDMNLPSKGGGEVLRYLRKSRRLAGVPVIVTTSSESQIDRDEIMRLGANAFFHKPISYADFMSIGGLMSTFLPAGARQGAEKGCKPLAGARGSEST